MSNFKPSIDRRGFLLSGMAIVATGTLLAAPVRAQDSAGQMTIKTEPGFILDVAEGTYGLRDDWHFETRNSQPDPLGPLLQKNPDWDALEAQLNAELLRLAKLMTHQLERRELKLQIKRSMLDCKRSAKGVFDELRRGTITAEQGHGQLLEHLQTYTQALRRTLAEKPTSYRR